MKLNKLTLIAFISTSILFSVIFLSGCTTKERNSIEYLCFSNDGEKLISFSTGQGSYDLFVWDISNGNKIFEKHPLSYNHAFFSPGGNYIVFGASIYNISTGSLITKLPGNYKDWSDGGKIVTTNGSKFSVEIEIWSGTNFSKIKTIQLNEAIIPSIGVKIHKNLLTYVPQGKNSPTIMDIRTDNKSSLANSTIKFTESSAGSNYNWLEDGKELGLIYSDFSNFYIINWNSTNGDIIYNKSSTEVCMDYISKDLKKYVCSKDKKIEIYDFQTDSKISDIEVETPSTIGWYRDNSLIAIGDYNGVIKIFNTSTGNCLQTLKTPVYENSPGFELLLIFISIVLILFYFKAKRS